MSKLTRIASDGKPVTLTDTTPLVRVASGTIELNVGNKNDKDLVALMQSYVDAFMEQYK